MLYKTGTVISRATNSLVVRFKPAASASCCSKGGCAIKDMKQEQDVSVDNVGASYQVGDVVQVAIMESGLLQLIFLLYGLPLLGFLVGLVCAASFNVWNLNQDLFALLCGGCGCLAACVVSRKQARKLETKLTPKIVACIASNTIAVSEES